MHRLITRLAVLAVMLALAGCTGGPAPQATAFRKPGAPIYSIAAFDPARLPGNWVEIAAFAPEGARCQPGGLAIKGAGRGLTASGHLCRAGRQTGLSGALAGIGPGRLSLAGEAEPLWVVWVDTDYRTLVIGTPSGRFGWILNRGDALPADRMKAAREILEWNGYDLSRLQVLR